MSPSPRPPWVGRAVRATPLAWLALLFSSAPTLAQQATITGHVTDESTGRAIASARVQVVGTTISVLSGADGEYVINSVTPGAHQLRVQLIGYNTVTQRLTVPISQGVTVDFAMRPAVISMDEVVITGTAGTARRREIGNTIAQVTVQDIQDAPVTSVADVLQGRTAGLTVMDNSGQVGAGKTIRLRGIKSVSQGNTPLIYVDGVRITNRPYATVDEASQAGSPLNDINPQDIERVEIVKGAAATTLYGTEASAGVIQIFTKRGGQGRPQWSLLVEQGLNKEGHIGPKTDTTGLFMNNCTMSPGCPSNGTWFRKGYVQSYTGSVRGGIQNLTYFFSGHWGDQNGVIAPQGTQDWGVRGNFGFAPSNSVSITFNNSYADRRTLWFPDGNNAEGFTLNVWRGPNGYTPNDNDSLILSMGLNQSSRHFTSGTSIGWTPVPGMTHSINAGLDFAQSDYQEDHPYGYWNTPLGTREDDQYQARTMTLDYHAAWEKKFGGFSSNFSWGGQLYNENRYRLNGFGFDFAAPGDKVVDSGARTEAFETRVNITNGGFFFQEMIGLSDQLFLTGGLRVDGHSAFGSNFGLAPYPKVSLSYMLSDHSFWPSWWEQMKLRAAYGESGKAPGVFDAAKTWEAISGDDGQPAVTPSNLGNPDLGPERTREIETGFEGTLFDSRVAVDFSYYYEKTYDALVGVQQIPSTGFIGRQLENVGSLENRGLEGQLNLSVLRGSGLSWDLGFRYSHSKSKAIDLGDGDTLQVNWRQEIVKGRPVPAYYHDVVVNPNEVGVAPIFELQYIGPTYPTHTWGINTTVNLAGRFTLDALGEGQGGHVLSSGTAYQNVRRNVWQPCQSVVDAIAAGNTANLTAYERARCDRNYTTYGMWIEPADFFKLRQVSLSYNLPKSILPFGVRSGALRLQGRNLLLITDWIGGMDPEASENGSNDELYRQEYYNLPAPRTFLVSLKLEF